MSLAENVGSGTDATRTPIHKSHQNGTNIDIRYIGATALRGGTAYDDADVDRNTFIMDASNKQNAGLGAPLTGDPDKFGLDPIEKDLQDIHRDHMRFQNNYPRLPKPKK